MKVPLDECLPRKLKDELPDHTVSTVPKMGWAGKQNRELFRPGVEQSDTWHATHDDAMNQADFEFGVKPEEWDVVVDEEVA